MKFADIGRNHWMAVLVACGLLICLTLIPIVHHRMASQPETLPIMSD